MNQKQKSAIEELTALEKEIKKEEPEFEMRMMYYCTETSIDLKADALRSPHKDQIVQIIRKHFGS